MNESGIGAFPNKNKKEVLKNKIENLKDLQILEKINKINWM